MADHLPDGPDTLRVPFIFVKHGDPPPLDWMARHPGWVKIPAVMIPRNSPHHPANGGPYPTFQAPPPAERMAPVAEAGQWPLGRPVSAGLHGAMSRLKPGGGPPRYPGGLGTPPGTFPGLGGGPVAAFLRANTVLDRVTEMRNAPTQAAAAELAQSLPVSPVDMPRPPVLSPGAPDNEGFVRPVVGAAPALERAAEGFSRNKADDTPG